MNRETFKLAALGLALAVCVGSPAADAMIRGISGTSPNPIFHLSAKTGYISTPDGGSYLMWGYAEDPNAMQYPGPTLIVNQGDTVTVNLTNTLAVPVSMVFPGHLVTASGGSPGLLTSQANPNGGTISYSFTAAEPGTYMYHSGTDPALQIEMGLVGALIVRPTGFSPMMPRAYEHMDSMYTREVLFLETEMDPNIHIQIEQGDPVELDKWWPVNWFLNGRCAPDTMLAAHNPLLPHQPYNCMPMMRPGERLLMRVISAGRDPHPFHTHGNNFDIIARDGRMLQSAPGAGTNLSVSDFTITVSPGGTADAIFTWTSAGLGWDIYGHDPNDPMEPGEYAPDHGKPFPVALPTDQELTFGGWWTGSPFLGAMGTLPPGEGGNNPDAGYIYMWHSHAEKEMVNNDIFPGGLMTMLMIVPPSGPIMEH